MYEARERQGETLVRCTGSVGRAELAAIAALARRALRAGRQVVLDLEGATCPRASAAALLDTVRGLRAFGPSHPVRDAFRGGQDARPALQDHTERPVRAA